MVEVYDVIVIGMGPAGMAVAAMASAMGLKVCGVEKRRIGGECMNVGCIPSKALLRVAAVRALFERLGDFQLKAVPKPDLENPFGRIADHLASIYNQKTLGMFKKVALIQGEGAAEFVDAATVRVGERLMRGRRIFLCVGTRPELPPVPGLDAAGVLTNETLFDLREVPGRLLVLGGGAIACEMAQAFARLGSKVTMVFRGPRLLWREDEETSELLERQFEKEGIVIHRNRKMDRFDKDGQGRYLLAGGERIGFDAVLAALGRRHDFSGLALDKASVAHGKGGIAVNKHLQTSLPNIYACGDCNGYRQLTHAAMHQGMIALMNCLSPWPFKRNYTKYPVPSTIFTEPEISRVGASKLELEKRGAAFETVTAYYGDYGAAIAEEQAAGHVKAFVTRTGRILGVTIAGAGSGEMINEWTMAMQNGLRMHRIMLQQHSFPTMGFLSKRVAETWMMGKMESRIVRWLCGKLFKF